MLSVYGSIIIMVVGIALVFLSRELPLDDIIKKVLYIIGVIFIIVGILLFVLNILNFSLLIGTLL